VTRVLLVLAVARWQGLGVAVVGYAAGDLRLVIRGEHTVVLRWAARDLALDLAV